MLYVDPLAPFYNRILQIHKIDRPAIRFGMIESLSGTFARNSVDFIHVRNALDHCANPVSGIVECLAVLKPGAILYLNHFRDEALNEAYRGFHQYNITERDGKLIIWNKEKETDVTDYLAGIADVTTTVAHNGRIVAVIEKLHDLPARLYSSENVARQSTERMMEAVEFFHSTSNTVNYQAKRFISFCGHNLMRLMPMKFLKRIKRVLRHRKR